MQLGKWKFDLGGFIKKVGVVVINLAFKVRLSRDLNMVLNKAGLILSLRPSKKGYTQFFTPNRSELRNFPFSF